MDNSFDSASTLKYSSKPMQLENIAVGIHRRLENNLSHWKRTRRVSFDSKRNITQASPGPTDEANTKANPQRRRRQQLEKWKEEKKNKKILLYRNKKPLFTVSAAQLSYPLKYVPSPPIKPVPSTSGCVTRSQSTRAMNDNKPAPQSFAHKNVKFHVPQTKTPTKLPMLALPKSKKDVVGAYTYNSVHLRKSSNPSKKKLNTPKKPVPRSESSLKDKQRSPKSAQDVPMTPEQQPEDLKKISSFVNLLEGKNNAHKELKKKMEGLFEKDGRVMNNVEHFQRQLSFEAKRMMEICNQWDNIYKEIALPDFVKELVLCAVGHARLLVSQKTQQFESLAQRCVHPDLSLPLVTLADLHSVKDMFFMQMEYVNMRFKELEEMRAYNWAKKAPAPARGPPAPTSRRPRRPRPPRPPHSARPTAAPASSNAARKAKSHQQETQPPPEKIFDAGFFTLRSPVHSTVPRTSVQRDTTNLAIKSKVIKAFPSKRTPLPTSTPASSILKQPLKSANEHYTARQSVSQKFDPHARFMDKKTKGKQSDRPRIIRQNAVDIPDTATENSETMPSTRMVTRKLRKTMPPSHTSFK